MRPDFSCDRVDVVGERQRDDVGLEPVDHAARLLAGAAVRLADVDRLTGLLLPLGAERLVDVLIQLARGIVRDVEELDLRPGGAADASSAPIPSIPTMMCFMGSPLEVDLNASDDDGLRVAVLGRRGGACAAGEARALVVHGEAPEAARDVVGGDGPALGFRRALGDVGVARGRWRRRSSASSSAPRARARPASPSRSRAAGEASRRRSRSCRRAPPTRSRAPPCWSASRSRCPCAPPAATRPLHSKRRTVRNSRRCPG